MISVPLSFTIIQGLAPYGVLFCSVSRLIGSWSRRRACPWAARLLIRPCSSQRLLLQGAGIINFNWWSPNFIFLSTSTLLPLPSRWPQNVPGQRAAPFCSPACPLLEVSGELGEGRSAGSWLGLPRRPVPPLGRTGDHKVLAAACLRPYSLLRSFPCFSIFTYKEFPLPWFKWAGMTPESWLKSLLRTLHSVLGMDSGRSIYPTEIQQGLQIRASGPLTPGKWFFECLPAYHWWRSGLSWGRAW